MPIYPPNVSHFDGNQVPSAMGVIGTLGTADTGGTALPLPFAVNPATGGAYVHVISGTTTTDETEVTGFNGGTVSVGTAAVELTFTGTPQSIMITADFANGTVIYLGASNVTQAGANAITFLQPDQSVTLDLNDTSAALYAVGGTTGQKAYKVALT